MRIKVDRLIELGVPLATLRQKIEIGEWKSPGPRLLTDNFSEQEVLLESLPQDIQLKWAQRSIQESNLSHASPLLTGLTNSPNQNESPEEQELERRLTHLNTEERKAWIGEAKRLAGLIERYDQINPKREWDRETNKYKFVPAVIALCQEAACTNPVIIRAKPHRARIPAAHTLDGWLRSYRGVRLLTFTPAPYTKSEDSPDQRRAEFSADAIDWINRNWSNFSGARHLYKALKTKAETLDWTIPSESWFYRKWVALPEIVRVMLLEGKNAYESKLAPYVPRHVTDLAALQILSGDFSERDVTVCLPDGTLARPWLALWICLRTDLRWGWNLDLVPSSHSAAIAYANGVRNFGAQPFARPDEGFYSYIYTDRGKQYRSHNWDGHVIAVHQVDKLDEGLEFIMVERRVGILDELKYRHLTSRGKNPKENPVERVHRIISEWEQNTFKEYCGRGPSNRPDAWRKLYAEHMSLAEDRRTVESPFISFEAYREKLAEFFVLENSSLHEKSTLGGARIVPINEFKRLYTTQYTIRDETLVLLLMKSVKRTIGKDGVRCFQNNWWYYHPQMSIYKGTKVEVRYLDDDFSRVWVILPNHEICEAELLTPSSLLNPNKQTLQAIKDARAHEREITKNFQFVVQSELRGESVEDRVNRKLINTETSPARTNDEDDLPPAQVHLMTRLDKPKLLAVTTSNEVTADDVSKIEVDNMMFAEMACSHVREFDGDE